MANTYQLTPQAEEDLEAIWWYIARDNLAAADRVMDKCYDVFEMLAEHPLMGHKREDLTAKPLRFWTVYSYMIMYNPHTQPIRILRVRSGYTDLLRLLDGEP